MAERLMAPESSTTRPPLADPLTAVWLEGIRVAALQAAIQLELWAKIKAGQTSAERLAAENGWDLAGVQALLDALYAMELLERDTDGGYRLVPVSEHYLIPQNEAYLGESLLSDLNWGNQGQLAQAIRSGQRPLDPAQARPNRGVAWATYTAARVAEPQRDLQVVLETWRDLGVQPDDNPRILDLGCGAGVMSLALAWAGSNVEVTLVDWPPVLDIAAELADRLGVSEQVNLLPGDLHELAYPVGSYEVVWLGQILHFFDHEQIERLLSKAYQALAPAGRLFIAASMPDDERRGPEDNLLASLALYASSAGGQAYTGAEYQYMLESSGFSKVTRMSDEIIRAVRV